MNVSWQRLWRWWLIALAIGCGARTVAADADGQIVNSLSMLKRVSSETRVPHDIALDVSVLYVDVQSGQLIVRDSTDSVEIFLDCGENDLHPGDRLRISGTGTLMNRGCGYELAAIAVVDNDGIHSEQEKSTTILLEAGVHAVRLDWFNASDIFRMSLEYAGPGFSRRPIPDENILISADAGSRQTTDIHGLNFRAYRKRLWMLPVSPQVGTLLLSGVAKNFDHSVTGGREYTGVSFNGALRVDKTGEYTFFLKSDDGSRLFIGRPSLNVEKLVIAARESALPKAQALFPGQILDTPGDYLWVTVEGRLSRASRAGSDGYYWLSSGSGAVRVEMPDASTLPAYAVDTLVQMTGVVRRGNTQDGVPLEETLFVQDSNQVRVVDIGMRNQGARITPVKEVERLQRESLDGRHTVQVRGVVTRVISSVPGVVLQDESRGIYINLEHMAVGPVQIGELLEVSGFVEAGEFSPYIVASAITRCGAGILPNPIRASRDEMTNGSLHSQYVEIEGYVLAVDSKTITLRTRSGVLRVETETEPSSSWLDSVVRMRGCLRVFWDPKTRQITPGRVGMDYAEITTVREVPKDLFDVTKKTAPELLMFDPYAEPFQRTRLVGQLVHQNGTELCLMDGGQGVRVSLVAPIQFTAGDMLEIAGFPDFDGPSPHFDHAIARKVGGAALPVARVLPVEKLLNDTYDATRVVVEAELIDMGFQNGHWTLQLRAGTATFPAQFDAFPETKPDYAPGSRLRLTGIYQGLGGSRSLDRPVGAFELMVASVADVQVLATPPWWTLPRLLAVVAVLCVVLALATLWISSLRRQVARKTAQLETVLEERHRVEQAEALAKERSRMAYDLHDELGAGLSEIGMMSALAASPSLEVERRQGYLQRLTDKARRLVASLDEIVWAVNPRYDPVASFASYYTTYAQQFLALAELRCRLDVEDDLPPDPLSSRIRHTLFLAFKEVLTNVAKHAQATEVVIRIFVEKETATRKRYLVISIADNGRGIQTPDRGTSDRRPGMDGLASMAARLRQLDGECIVERNEPSGTKINLKVPL